MLPVVQSPRRLYRSPNDRILSGLAGGMAEYFGVDAAWVRLGLVVLVLLGVGTPVLLYLLGWLIVPRNPQPSDLSRDRLHRSHTDRMIAGVCGGLAETLGADPTVIRLIAAVLLLTGGVALPFYLIAWFILPSQEGSEPPHLLPERM
ncbi:MAG TPA: PspC domain-containing protein [Stenomitos sp.]